MAEIDAQNLGTEVNRGQDLHQDAYQNGEGQESHQVEASKGADATAGSNSSAGGKIFIGGISWDTTTEMLKAHFGKYGELTDAVIMKDRNTRNPRGFGFVTFADPSICDRVVMEKHVIDGRTVEAKKSVPQERIPAGSRGPRTKKIFVGGLPPQITEEEFKSYFQQFGPVTEHQIMQDHTTGRSRGFGFVTFESEQTVENILAQGKMHEMSGKQVEIKKAEPKRNQEGGMGGGNFSGGGRGGYGVEKSAYGGGGGGYGEQAYGGGSYGSGYGGGYGGARAAGYGSSYGGRGASAYGGSYGGGYGAEAGGYGASTGGYGGTAYGGSSGYGGSLGGYGASVGSYGGSLGASGYASGGYGADEYASGYGGYGAAGSTGYGSGTYGSSGYGGGLTGGAAAGGYGTSRTAGYGATGAAGSARYHPYGR